MTAPLSALEARETAAEVIALLSCDEAYDADPNGDPPLWTANYRAALRAAVIRAPRGPRSVAGLTSEQIDAYRAGQADVLLEINQAIVEVLRK